METHYSIRDRVDCISIRSPMMPDLIICILLFLSTSIVYVTRLAPSVFRGDSADATIASYVLGIPHPPGFPAYTWLGHIFTIIPIGDIAYRVNLMSAFFGALTIPVIYIIMRYLAPRGQGSYLDIASRAGCIIGSVSFAFSVYYWAVAEIAEVYTLNSFFIASMILLVLIWAEKKDNRLLYLGFLLFSLSLGVNAANILFAPSFLVFLYLIDRKALLNKKILLYMVVIFSAVGILQLLYLYVRAWQGPDYTYTDIRNFEDFLYFVTAQEYSNVPFSLPFSLGMRMYVNFLKENFTLIGIAIGIIGMAQSLSRDMLKSAFLISIFVINVFFFAQYNSFDLYDKLIPSFMIFSIFIGLGICELSDLIMSYSKKPLAPEIEKQRNYLMAILIILILIVAAIVPISSYISNSQKVDQSASIVLPYFLAQALNQVPANSTIIDMWQLVMPLRYFQIVYHINPTVHVIGASPADWPDMIQEQIDSKEVFLFRGQPANENLVDKYSMIPFLNMPGVGTLYKVNQGYPSFSISYPVIQHPIRKLLDGKIELLGYDLNQTEEKDSFRITYFWQIKENLSNDYIFALSLIDQNGNVALEDVHAPIYDIYPTSKWTRGEIYVERYNISLPPTIKPGIYQLSMREAQNVDKTSAYDLIYLGNIEVGTIDTKGALVNYGTVA
jgi:hypothetical protein